MLPRTAMFDAILFVPADPGQQVSVRFWANNGVQAKLRILSELPEATVLSLTARPRPTFDLLSPFLSKKVLTGLPTSGHYARRKRIASV